MPSTNLNKQKQIFSFWWVFVSAEQFSVYKLDSVSQHMPLLSDLWIAVFQKFISDWDSKSQHVNGPQGPLNSLRVWAKFFRYVQITWFLARKSTVCLKGGSDSQMLETLFSNQLFGILMHKSETDSCLKKLTA